MSSGAPDGRQFLVASGFSDAQRRDPPAVGSVATYRYRNLMATEAPRLAGFLRIHDAP